MKGPFLLGFIFSAFLPFRISSIATTDTIYANQSIKDGETIVSSSGYYEVGFFSPLGDKVSKNRYLGMWYHFSKETVVWVANAKTPLIDTSGVLQVTSQGVLVVYNSTGAAIWTSGNRASTQAWNPLAQILDTGNLVVREANDTNEDNNLWESFDYLGNTLLPGVKFGKNLVTGIDRYLVSWKSDTDPSPGDSTYRMDTNGYPEVYITSGETIVFRSGPWNGLSFAGLFNLRPNSVFSYQFNFSKEEVYCKYELIDKSLFSRLVHGNQGLVQRFNWSSTTRTWNLYQTLHIDDCDRYAICGAFGICSAGNSPMCACLEGFSPKFSREWECGNWSGGCARKHELVCGTGEGFQTIDGVKLPDTSKSWINTSLKPTECESECLRNCSCTAYSTLDIAYGSGCLFWQGHLLNIRYYDGNGQTLYLRLSSWNLSQSDAGSNPGNGKLIGIVVSGILFAILMAVLMFCICSKKSGKKGIFMSICHKDSNEGEEEMELPVFDLATVVRATDFSRCNKLGEGGFGPVYKGTLANGQEIAVKRLSRSSRQGMSEFRNEVILIAKLQHRNLVRLVGCCFHEDEKMLIYEFMPNKSLDSFIFDERRRQLLGWSKRLVIIEGIARGLLYLHQDSRLRVVHRDLKASNVLLNKSMNPKISDFGIARMCRGKQFVERTKIVVGTYGYMPPEYAVNGPISTKSDVFSYGVLVLEIISGLRNRGFSHPDHSFNLLGHAWTLWVEGRPMELVDKTLHNSLVELEVIRCIHVALLCVQQRPEDRPKMSSAVVMLGSDTALPEPTQPGFYTERSMPESKILSCQLNSSSMNELTITSLEAR